jgi:hypothetical protein
MKKMFLVVAIAAATTLGSGAGAGQLPTLELTGFPITRTQVAILGSAGVQESAAMPTLVLGGMPASPHQIAVLTPRRSMTAGTTAVNLTTVGLWPE